LRDPYVRACLATAAATVSVGLLQVIVFPRWPRINATGIDLLALQGKRVASHRLLLPALGSATVAQSALHEFSIPLGTVTEPIQPDARRDILLRIRLLEPRNWRAFQVADVTAGISALEIKQRTLNVLNDDELAKGQIMGKLALQTCLREKGNGVVTQKSFFALSFEEPLLSRQQQLLRILGLRQNRTHQCLLVTLQVPQNEKDAAAELIRTWKQLRPSLAAHLTKITRNSSAIF